MITEMIIEKGTRTLVIIKQKQSPFYLGLSKNKNELTLLIPYHSNNKKTVYISKPLVNFNFRNAALRPYKQVYVNMPQKKFCIKEIRTTLCISFLFREIRVRGMLTFLYLGSSQIINDTPPPPQKKTRKKLS